MMETMQTTTTRDIPVTGIGARLRSAREALQMSEKEAAARLHLSVKYINLMEEENFNNDTPVTFMRGYLRSYGRILNISDQEMADALNQLGMPTPAPKGLTTRLRTPISNNNEKFVRWISYLIGIILLVLIGMWWSSHTKDSDNTKIVSVPENTAPSAKQSTTMSSPVQATTPANHSNDVDFATTPDQSPESDQSDTLNLTEPTPSTVIVPTTPRDIHNPQQTTINGENINNSDQNKPTDSGLSNNHNAASSEGTNAQIKAIDDGTKVTHGETKVTNDETRTTNERTKTTDNETNATNDETTSAMNDDEDNPPPSKHHQRHRSTHRQMVVPEPGLDTSDF